MGPGESIVVLTAEHLLRGIVRHLRGLVVAHDDLGYLPLARTHQYFLRYIVILDLRLVQEGAIILVVVRQLGEHLRFFPISRPSVLCRNAGSLWRMQILLGGLVPLHELALLVLCRLPLVRAHRVRSVTALVEKPVLVLSRLMVAPVGVLALGGRARVTVGRVVLFGHELVGRVLLVLMLTLPLTVLPAIHVFN